MRLHPATALALLTPSIALSAPPPDAPWPVFRGDARNSGIAKVAVNYTGKKPWSYRTGKGIFSTPVVDGQERIYVGSADRTFYVLHRDGSIAWTFPTGEIIDSAALLSVENGALRVTVPSGDGYLYHLDADPSIVQPDDRVLWKFDSSKHRHPKDIGWNWFEGNVVQGPDGTLYAGSTNWNYYALDPLTGALKFRYLTNNMNWSAGAFDDEGNVYWTSLDFRIRKFDPVAQQERWKALTLGFVSASVALGSDNRAYVGSFDNKLHALDTQTGKRLWSFSSTDHIYASAALSNDTTGKTQAIYFTSTDGHLYKLDARGKLVWKYDAGDVIRSSPVITAKPQGETGDIIYFGAADGRLYAINSEGSLRWAYDTNIDEPGLRDRNDLNASPAVGRDGLYIAGEHGHIWHVPFDYPLHHPEDPRATTRLELPRDQADIRFATPGGSSLAEATQPVPAATVVHGHLKVRQAGNTLDASLNIRNRTGLRGTDVVSIQPAVPLRVERSADGHHVHVVPEGFLQPDTEYTLDLRGEYTWGGTRIGSLEFPGTRRASISDTLTFRTAPVKVQTLPLEVTPDSTTMVLMRRLAVPYPSMLTSLNQIGFDSLTWILSLVDKTPPDANGEGRFIMWAVGAEKNAEGQWHPHKATEFIFPLYGRYRHDSFILENVGTPFDVSGIRMPMDKLQMRGQWDADFRSDEGATFYAEVSALRDSTYGPLLALGGLINANLKLIAAGTFQTERHTGAGVDQRPRDLTVGSVSLKRPGLLRSGELAVNFTRGWEAARHMTHLLLVDRRTGKPLYIDYRGLTRETVDGEGRLTRLTLSLPARSAVGSYTDVWVMADAFPLAKINLATVK